MPPRPPTAVWIAVAALGVVIALQAALAWFYARGGNVGWWRFAFAIALFAALIAGLLRGLRLAWLWGRFLTLVLGVVMVASVTAGFARHELPALVAAVALGGVAIPLFAASFALGRPSSHSYFGLVCPACGQHSSFGADFLFRRARCRRCHTEW
jgi:hypothetical protein